MMPKSTPLIESRAPVRTLGVAVAILLAGCAQPSLLETHPGTVLVTQDQVAEYERTSKLAAALSERVRGLEQIIEILKKRVARVEPRVGFGKASSAMLKTFPGGATAIRLPDAHRVEHFGAKPRRLPLMRFLQGRRGVVIAFWATWCVPCTTPEELRNLERLQRELQAHGAELISMPIDGLDKVTQDRRASTWVYPLFQRDAGHLDILPRSFVSKVGVNLPLFLVIDRSGRVTHYHDTVLSPAVIREMITHTAFRG
jgi:thiol-disulfide isomerase/thioredoxin